jgi:hypothetical protein
VALNETHAKLEESITAYNEAVKAAFGEVTDAQVAYNEAIVAANDFQEEIATVIDDYKSEKSDKWQESDKASEYDAWHDALEAFDEIDLESAEELEVPENVSEEMEARPWALGEA